MVACGGEGVVQILEHVVGAEGLVQARLGEREKGLSVDAGEEQTGALAAALPVELLESVHAGGVQGGDLAHAEDEDARRTLELVERVLEPVGDAEEERAVDLVDL